MREYCQTDEAGRSLLQAAMQQLQMSARAVHEGLNLRGTVADLGGSEIIKTAHLAEAIQYRPRRQVRKRVGSNIVEAVGLVAR